MTNVELRARCRRTVGSILLAGALTVTGGAFSTAAAAAGQTVRGRLLPIPAAAPGQEFNVTAIDVTPLGVVGGTAQAITTGPDGTRTAIDTPLRWAELPRVGWVRQRLTLPAGATSGSVDGLTDHGEPAGSVTLDGATRAVRWSLDGQSTTQIGGAGSLVDAVGPRGPWGVHTAGPNPIAGEAELVTRAGARTPLRGTPELDAGYRRSVSSIADEGTAIVWVVDGIGRGTSARPVLWKDGATKRLPVINYPFLAPACVSRVLGDGSVVTSGYAYETGTPNFVLIRHVGGVPGTDVELFRATGPGQPLAGLGCGNAQPSNGLAPDGGVAGYVSTDADGRRAAYWNAANVLTVVPRGPGEVSATGAVAASGGRMVILAELEDGGSRLSLWRNGNRTELPAPRGWSVSSVVELTESGVLVANVRDAAGTTRPAAWNLGRP
ncbi:hypothetical protein [Actinoplanes sp. NPDC049118]|uniref:hypothetical protein n=1 Tax=Actinoplanes sp. NPDC049118 TaxID=3155769 RepID=UPI0033F50FC8